MKSGAKRVGRVRLEATEFPKKHAKLVEKARESAEKAAAEAVRELSKITLPPKGFARGHPSLPKEGELRTSGKKFPILVVPSGCEKQALERGYTFGASIKEGQIWTHPSQVEDLKRAVQGREAGDFVIVTK